MGYIKHVAKLLEENRAMKARNAEIMTKVKNIPRPHVFHFRADDDLAAQIREAAKGYHSTDELLKEAIKEKLRGVSIDR